MADEGARPEAGTATRSTDVARLVGRFDGRIDEVVDGVLAAVRDEILTYGEASPGLVESVRAQMRLHIELLLAVTKERRSVTAEELAFVRPAAADRARSGVPLTDWLHAFRIGLREVWRALLAEAEAEAEDEAARQAALSAAEGVMEYINAASSYAAEVYLEIEQLLHAQGERVRRDLLADLLDGRQPEPGPRLDAARDAELSPGTSCLLISAMPTAPPDDEYVLRSAARALAAACGGPVEPLVVVRRDEIVSVVAMTDRDPRALSARLVDAHQRLAAQDVVLAIGVSAVQRDLDGIPAAYRQARAAQESVGATGGVLALPALSAFEYLARFGASTAWDLLDERVRAFVDDDLADGGVLCETLLAYAAADMNAKAASERLFVHVNTAHYRLAKIAERTGCDLRSLADVVELLIAVELACRSRPL